MTYLKIEYRTVACDWLLNLIDIFQLLLISTDAASTYLFKFFVFIQKTYQALVQIFRYVGCHIDTPALWRIIFWQNLQAFVFFFQEVFFWSNFCALLCALRSPVGFFASRFPFLDVSRQGTNVLLTVLSHFLNFPPLPRLARPCTMAACLSVYGMQATATACIFSDKPLHLNHRVCVVQASRGGKYSD